MNKTPGRRPATPTQSRATSTRFTPRATVAAERASAADALFHFEPEFEPPSSAPEPPRAAVTEVAGVAARASGRLAPQRAPAGRWTPAPIWLAMALPFFALVVWGATRVVGVGTSQRPVASASPDVIAPQALATPIEPAPAPAAPAAVVAAVAPRTESVQRSAPPIQRAVRRDAPSATPLPERFAVPARPASAPAVSAAAARDVAPVGQRAPAAPTFRGSLAIGSEPEGAVVLVNGRFVGNTPLLLNDLPAGSRVVRVEADGYEPWSAAVRVVADQETRVLATLRR